MRALRWGDNDRYFGPFTYSRNDGWRPLALVLGSGDGDEHPHCRLRISGFGRTLIVRLPAIVRPWRVWVDTSKRSWSTGPEGGYWDIGEREYGFTVSDGHLSVALGRVTNDSSTEQRWGCFLPWTQWRTIRHSLHGLSGEPVFVQRGVADRETAYPRYEKMRAAREVCPARAFDFRDFDGEQLVATTRIEESERRFGTGWFRWLSLFRRSRVSRSLDIRFSGETGRRKGSWKGGTVGHGISMLPGELHESAFRRYCAEHEMAFAGGAS